VTASIRSIHGLDGSRRRLITVEEAAPEPVVLPEPPEPREPREHRETRESREGPKHRRPSRLQLWWRPERPQAATPPPIDHAAQQPPDITRTILELTDERFQELALRLDRLSDEVAGLSRALDERSGEIDRARWLLGDKLSGLVERLDYD
jgi:hypothetical protein